MQKIPVKKWIVYPVAAVFFLVLSYGFVPQIFQGKVLNQGDISAWQAMAKEAKDYNQTHEDEALWTNSMFSGMPTITINKVTRGNYTRLISRVLEAGKAPASYLFLSLVGGFLLFLALGVNGWLAMGGAIAITFCAYNMQIIQAGHVTKMIAIAYMPWVLASLVFAYRKNALWGALFFCPDREFPGGCQSSPDHLLPGIHHGILFWRFTCRSHHQAAVAAFCQHHGVADRGRIAGPGHLGKSPASHV